MSRMKNLALDIQTVREALANKPHAAIEAFNRLEAALTVNPMADTDELASTAMVAGDGFLWLYFMGRWTCAVDLADEDDEIDWPTTRPHSVWDGFEAWRDIADTFNGVRG